MNGNLLINSILKWVRGKRQLLPEIVPMINEKCPVYMEPFVDGGAVSFNMQPKRAIINDYNEELISMYNTVRDHLAELIGILIFQKEVSGHIKNHKWCTNFTHIHLADESFKHNCTVLDLFDRSVLANITDNQITF